MVWDWAQTVGDDELAAIITAHARRLYLADRGAPLEFEPSGSDFLSPSLAEADLLRRVLPQAEFSRWLTGFYGEGMMESLPRRLAPVQVVDPRRRATGPLRRSQPEPSLDVAGDRLHPDR